MLTLCAIMTHCSGLCSFRTRGSADLICALITLEDKQGVLVLR